MRDEAINVTTSAALLDEIAHLVAKSLVTMEWIGTPSCRWRLLEDDTAAYARRELPKRLKPTGLRDAVPNSFETSSDRPPMARIVQPTFEDMAPMGRDIDNVRLGPRLVLLPRRRCCDRRRPDAAYAPVGWICSWCECREAYRLALTILSPLRRCAERQ